MSVVRGSLEGVVAVAEPEPEITSAVKLCDSRGRLLAGSVGWSRHPLHICNVTGHPLRKKKWDYWCVTSDRCLFSVTLSNIDYMGLAFAYFLDFETRRFIEQTVMTPLGKGCVLPATVGENIAFRHRKLNLSFTQEEGGNDAAESTASAGGAAGGTRSATRTRLRVESPDFGGVPLRADILVTRPEGHETLNVVIPWSRRRFQFTSKQNAMPAAGSVILGKETFTFAPGTAYACLDFGRGVWPYASFWNWASASGRTDGHVVGLNLGAGWTDGTGMTENGLTVDGRLTKLGEDVEFLYDPADFTRPWTIRTKGSDRVDLRFDPFFERVAKTDLLILRSEVHQLIGRFTGTVTAAGGLRVAVEGLIGWAEEHRARW